MIDLGSVIFAITLVLTIMIVTAPPGLQNIAAQCVDIPRLRFDALMYQSLSV